MISSMFQSIFTKLRQCRRDYIYHGYGELCNFVYCLLMKTRVAGCLPGIHEWEKYMSTDAIAVSPVVPADSFLANDNFGKTLMTKKTGELPEFRARCRQFLDRLIVVIDGSVSMTSGVSRCLYSFCSEILFKGDDSGVFALFADLCRLLKVCNLITANESRCAVDEFSRYVKTSLSTSGKISVSNLGYVCCGSSSYAVWRSVCFD